MCLLGIRKVLNFCCAVMLYQAVFVVDTAFFMLCFTDTLGCISCSCVIDYFMIYMCPLKAFFHGHVKHLELGCVKEWF